MGATTAQNGMGMGGGDDPPRILSAIAGMPKCFGVPDVQTGQQWGCAYTEYSSCGSTVQSLGGGCNTPNQANAICRGQYLNNNTAQDATPVTFNFKVDVNTVDAQYFQYNFADGSSTLASCAVPNAVPCNEGNEQQTIAIAGNAGGWTGFATSLTIVGPLMLIRPDGSSVSAQGLTYSGPDLDVNNGPVLLTADLEAFSADGELGAQNGAQYPNHCQVNFPSTTHRIRLLFNGGVTYDGLRSIVPDHTSLFELSTASGAMFPSQNYLGLADLGSTMPSTQCEKDTYVHDGDNYVDICLQMNSNTPPPTSIFMPCNSGNILVNPKGSAYPCAAQTVAVSS